MRSLHLQELRERGWIPTQMVQRVSPQRCTRGGRRVIPYSASPVCPGSLPKGPTQLWSTSCLCFQTWPAEGTRTTAQPPLVLDSEPGAQRHRLLHTHTPGGVLLLWDTRWESYQGSCRVEGGARRCTPGWGKGISDLPEASTSAPGVK